MDNQGGRLLTAYTASGLPTGTVFLSLLFYNLVQLIALNYKFIIHVFLVKVNTFSNYISQIAHYIKKLYTHYSYHYIEISK